MFVRLFVWLSLSLSLFLLPRAHEENAQIRRLTKDAWNLLDWALLADCDWHDTVAMGIHAGVVLQCIPSFAGDTKTQQSRVRAKESHKQENLTALIICTGTAGILRKSALAKCVCPRKSCSAAVQACRLASVVASKQSPEANMEPTSKGSMCLKLLVTKQAGWLWKVLVLKLVDVQDSASKPGVAMLSMSFRSAWRDHNLYM